MDKVVIQKIFDEAYEAHAKELFRFAYLRVSNYELAEDLTADTFVRFWEIVRKGKVVENRRALLYVIIRGFIVDYYRKNKVPQIPLDALAEKIPIVPDVLGEYIDTKNQVTEVQKTLSKLKDTYREVILMYYLEELTISEIAKALKKTKIGTRVIIHRALKALRQALKNT